jgi:endogenous inhibitor of DNA gyrase (YacG/DUF329 family)
MSNNPSNGSAGVKRSCPICDKASDDKWRPFCSKRCRDVDLNRWLSGSYALPAEPDDEHPSEEDGGEGEESGRRH